MASMAAATMGIQNGSAVMNAVIVWLARAVPIMLAMCLLAALTSVASAQGDPHVGTWELNLGKSTFNPGPPPQRQTLWYKAEGRGLTALLQGVDAAGKPISLDPSNLAINFDGRDHSTPRANYDSSAWTRISANQYVVNRKKAGKVVLTSTNVVSNDGKTLTITTKGVDEDGRPINNVRVYDKQ
jgi:hypothetical protein